MKFFRRKAQPPPPMVRPDSYRELTAQELEHIATHATCPYCRGPLYEGPSGGLCVNLLCRTEGCNSRFNFCDFCGQYIGAEKDWGVPA